MTKQIVIPNSFNPATGAVSFASVDNFIINRLLAIINATSRAMIYDPVTPNLGASSVAGSLVTLQYDTSSQSAADVLIAIYDFPTSSVGVNFSINAPTLPNVGSGFNSSAPYGNFLLLNTIPKNMSRASITIQNTSGALVIALLDDGTALPGAPPVNPSIISLGFGSGSGSSGTIWTSTTFKGRVQLYALSSSAFVSVHVD